MLSDDCLVPAVYSAKLIKKTLLSALKYLHKKKKCFKTHFQVIIFYMQAST